MKYELLHDKAICIYGYPEPLLEESVVNEAVMELVRDRKKLLADKKELMIEVKRLKERLPISASPPEEDVSTYQEKPERPSDGATPQERGYSPSQTVKDWTRTSAGSDG